MTDNKTLNETLRRLLATNIVCFTFKKVNGEIRHAKGTRNLTLARGYTGESIPTPTGYEQPNSYYDVESLGWRSYRPENLISIDKINGRETFADGTPVEDFPPKYTRDGVRVPSPSKEEIRKSWEELDKDIVIGAPAHSPKIGTPTATEKGATLPLNGVSVEDFAKLVAHYVVEELVSRIKG